MDINSANDIIRSYVVQLDISNNLRLYLVGCDKRTPPYLGWQLEPARYIPTRYWPWMSIVLQYNTQGGGRSIAVLYLLTYARQLLNQLIGTHLSHRIACFAEVCLRKRSPGTKKRDEAGLQLNGTPSVDTHLLVY